MNHHTAIRTWAAKQVRKAGSGHGMEELVVEEPLEILLEYSTTNGRLRKNIGVTMRTPGQDDELAIGFLYAEGVINNYDQVLAVNTARNDLNQVTVILQEGEKPGLQFLNRNFMSNASCGICGKISLEEIRGQLVFANDLPGFKIPAGLLYEYPERLSGKQDLFNRTGGIHAAALLDVSGNILLLREDIGRHNAVDKIVGAALRSGLNLEFMVLLLSGRAGYELIQKAVRAGISVVAAIGAPSSMAVELAVEAGLTLVGFLKTDRYNIYSGNERIVE